MTQPDRRAAAPHIDAFLRKSGWEGAHRRALAGDASNRRYERLHHPEFGAAVLMDAPPERGEDVRPFLRIGRHLSGLGLSAPHIFAADEDTGLLLLEDLGDDLFARVLQNPPAREEELYAAATDVLVHLAQSAPPEEAETLECYDAHRMGEAASLVISWYRRGIKGDDCPELTQQLSQEVEALCRAHCKGLQALALRDYHAENLIWLPGRTGLARVGLLDFQDAALIHPAYDLVSLLSDARRDVPRDLAQRMMERYLDATGFDREDFLRAAATLSAQRNLRILGVFARLGLRDGKPHYLDFIPRVWRLLQEDLRHPDLALLAATVEAQLPEPTPSALERLRSRCMTDQTVS
jgi:aminoglycoside/choline kinase family phosphotransferase